jgi:hypothetical protein
MRYFVNIQTDGPGSSTHLSLSFPPTHLSPTSSPIRSLPASSLATCSPVRRSTSRMD